MNRLLGHWQNEGGVGQGNTSVVFTCGFCGNRVATDKGWDARDSSLVRASIRICPQCMRPTFTEQGQQVPGTPYGSSVKNLPTQIEALYEEARGCIAAAAPTASTLCCRKLLMHVAVDCGAPEGEKFVEYVNYLEAHHFIPARAKAWVDQIRNKGNETNHEIKIQTRVGATELIDFVEMLLKVVYEYPSRVPPSPASASP